MTGKIIGRSEKEKEGGIPPPPEAPAEFTPSLRKKTHAKNYDIDFRKKIYGFQRRNKRWMNIEGLNILEENWI